MRPLSKAAETKLLAALEKAAELVNVGENPNAAIIKVARDENIPSGHIDLMVHAYNTGRTNKQREIGENTNEKAADFQLADANQILDALYPKVVKTSAQLVRESVVSTEYAVSPTGFIARRNAAMEKAASAKVALPEKTWEPAPRDEHSAARREYSKKVAAVREAEEARRVATAAYQKAAAKMEELATYFRTPGKVSFGDVMKEAKLRVGDIGVSILEKLANVYPQFKKQAATTRSIFPDIDSFDLLAEITDALEDYDDANRKAAAYKKAESVKKAAPEVVTGSVLYNPLEEPLELKKADASFPMGPSAMTRALGDTVYQGVGSYIKTPDQMRGEAFKEITDPDHERKLRNIRAQSVLADLVTNDPVISGHDPREVATAFNELAEVAPNFMDSSATVQALLRKRLEAGQLADFDIKQLVELEKIEAEKQKNILDARTREQSLI